MSRINDNETFWQPVTPGDFESITGYTRHKGKSMDNLTAQDINDMDKHNGMEVADCDDDVWGWVYDSHKEIGRWACGNTHDKRVEVIRDGYGFTELFEDGEPYRMLPEDRQSQPDSINPQHYQAHPSGVECIEITEHMSFNLGNAVKYIWRAGLKTDDPTEDLRKSLWYIQREINRIEGDDD